MKEDYTATSKSKDKQEAAGIEARLHKQEERADSKHEWISDPRETCGDYFDAFCSSFDPTKPLALMTGDFATMTQVKKEYRRTIQDFVAPT
jgi:hypothetical protein